MTALKSLASPVFFISKGEDLSSIEAFSAQDFVDKLLEAY
jgi:signal recognition particle GTPase